MEQNSRLSISIEPVDTASNVKVNIPIDIIDNKGKNKFKFFLGSPGVPTEEIEIDIDKNGKIVLGPKISYKQFDKVGEVKIEEKLLKFELEGLKKTNYFISGNFKKNDESSYTPLDTNIFYVGIPTTQSISPIPTGLAENINTFLKKDFSKVSLLEPERQTPDSQKIWIYIRNGVLNFNHYKEFLDAIFSSTTFGGTGFNNTNFPAPLDQTDAYTKLKFATDYYIKKYFDVNNTSNKKIDFFDNTNIENPISEQRRTKRTDINTIDSQNSYWLSGNGNNQYVEYFEAVLERMEPFGLLDPNTANRLFNDGSFDISKLQNLNLLELIWSYWHEEGGLVQTMNALSLRFQNVRLNANDPLAGLNIDPLRPINNLIWGYIEDERNRLSMARRNLEYQYEYGISLIGPAVPVVQVAESRSQFLPAFHNLLKTSIDFYQQANYTTVIPDGFPVLNSLREVHMLLSEGAHNQFGSLPWTARSEMMIQQWLLARPEMREFLGGRIMVPYQEPWMDRVDTMKTLQGWNPTNISHFHDLGAFGEQLLLSIRYGAWNDSGTTRDDAAEWAHYWREEIQRYVHAYKAATGVDLGNDVTDARISMPQNVERYTQPSVLIGRRVNSLTNTRPSQLNRLTQRSNIERY